MPDHIGVRCLPEALTNGYTGAPIEKDAVAASWDVTESVAGGAKLTLTVQWNTTDELPHFDRSGCGLARYYPTDGWTLDAANLAPAGGNDPFYRGQTPLEPGLYMVADEGWANNLRAAKRGEADSIQAPQTQASLYPNPSSGLVFIKTRDLLAIGDIVNIEVSNLGGKTVFRRTTSVTGENTVQLHPPPTLSPGCYLVRVSRENRSLFTGYFIRI
jgi:hypothetical protein